ncbi:putative Serine-threonine-protein [Naja naja]|nr:putative Serine-threonine-protein [Naja naja]
MPLGEYTFVRVVGKGSYGEVSLVRHRHDGKQYVIKRLNLKHASKRKAEQEAQLLSQLKHPNIITYRESWEGDDGLLYIVMGFCEGGDLYHKLKEQKGQLLPESQVVEWLVQIAMALQYLHEKHILHRDLKTQNVFLTRSNIIKVGDLGIARVLDNQHDMASTLIGTPYYMSPELFSNKPYNYKSDVWALGCCAYEMATLKHAFNAKDMNSLVYRIIEGKLPPMPKDYSTQLKELIRTMLSKKPEERPSVRSILRQPYIKQQIALFLEATKAKTSKNHKKVSESKPQGSSEKTELKKESTESQKLPNELSKKSNGASYYFSSNEDKCLINNKTFDVSSSKKLASEPEKNSKNGLNSLDVSLTTMSKVDILIVPLEKRNSATKQLAEHKESENVDIPNEAEPEKAKNSPELKEETLLKVTKTCPKTGDVDAKETDNGDSLDCTEKLLVPINPREILIAALGPRQLPTFPDVNVKIKGGPSIRQMSYNASTETKLPKEDSSIQIAQFTSESSTGKKKSLTGCCTEDELSSSASSTEKSDGDYKEKRLVEILRADVVQGIGVKLLEKVYDAMEEEDEQKKELCLRKLMGEKYTSYSMKARHLKFLEDNVKL